IDAHLLKGFLEGERIRAEVRGEFIFSVRREVPITTDTCPSVWIWMIRIMTKRLSSSRLLLIWTRRLLKNPEHGAVRVVRKTTRSLQSVGAVESHVCRRHAARGLPGFWLRRSKERAGFPAR